ncbi:uncharacterized protein LOC106171063 [Lingula anatina]|uniref:Uncharacterized protein LOC106171063 n=1 Tax=Lingula anatina TaxID=7574 RepID=A0A2R2MPX8_LINAN|nr:uncharacterized protein LOC106171063 [Lingula anatina]|eukprot:XP_023932294.1 uncharacterized protein LOC106171063 [Lingula anatina]
MRWDAGLGVLLLMLAGVLLLRCAEATYYDRRRTSYGNWFQKLKHGCVCRRPDTRESFDCLGHNHFVIKAKVMKSAESRDVIKPSVSYRPAAKYSVHIQHIFKDVSGSLKTGDNYVTANRSSFVCDTYLITGEEYLLKGKYVRGELRLGNMCEYGGQWDSIPRSRTNYLMSRGTCSLADRLQLPPGGELKSKNETKLDSHKKVPNSANKMKPKNELKLDSSKKSPSLASELKSKNERKLEPPKKAPSLLSEFKSKNVTKLVSSEIVPKKTLGYIRFEKLKHGCVCRRPDTRKSFDCLGNNHFVIKAKVMKSAESHDVIQPSVSYRPAAKYAVHIQHIFKDVSGSLKTGDNYVTANRSSFVCDTYLITGEDYLLKGQYVHGELRLGNMCEYGGQWDRIPRSRTNYLMSRGSCSLADRLQLPSGGELKPKNERKLASPKKAPSLASELKPKNERKLASPKKAPSLAGELKPKNERKLASPKKAPSLASELKPKNERKLASPKKAPSLASELKPKNERKLEPPKKAPSLPSEFKSKNETKLGSSEMAPKKTLGDIRFQKLKHGCVCRRPDIRKSFDCLENNHFVIKAKVMKSAESRDVIQPSVSYRPAAKYAVHIQHIFKDVSGSLKKGDNYVTTNRSSFVCDTYLITGEEFLLKGKYVRGELRLGNMCEYGGQWDKIPRSRTNYLMSRGSCSLADRLQLPSGGQFKSKNETKLDSPKIAPSSASELKSKNERKLEPLKTAPSLARKLKTTHETNLVSSKKAPSLASELKSKNETKLVSSKKAHEETLGEKGFEKLKHGCVCRRPDTRESFDCLGHNHFVIKAKVMKAAESRDVIQPSVSYRPAAKYPVHIQHIFKDVSGSLEAGDNYVTANRSSFVCDTYLITGEEYLLKGKYVRGELRLGNMCEYGGQWDRIPRSRTNYLMSRGTCSLADRLQIPSGGELKSNNERKLESPKIAPSSASELKSKNETKLEVPKKAPSLASKLKTTHETKLVPSKKAPSSLNKLKSKNETKLEPREKYPSLVREFKSKIETKLVSSEMVPSLAKELKLKNGIKLDSPKSAPSLASELKSKNETKLVSSKKAHKETLGEKGFEKLKHGCVCRRPDTRESFDCLGNNHFVIKAKVMKSAQSRDVIQPSVSYRPAAKYPVHIQHIFKDVSGNLETGDNYVTANRSSVVCDTYLITGEEYLLKGKYVRGELRLGNMCEYGGQWDRIPRSRTNYLMSRGTCSLAGRLQLPSGGEFNSKNETKLELPMKAPSSVSKLKAKNEIKLEPAKKAPSLVSGFVSKNETKVTSSKMAPNKTLGEKGFQKLKHGCVCRRPDTKESFDCLGDSHFVIKAKVMKSAESRDVIQPSVSYRPAAIYPVHIEHIFKDVSGSLKTGDNYVTANRSSFVCDTYLITGEEYLLKGKFVRGELRLGNMCEYGGQWDRIPRSRTNYLMSRSTCSLADRRQLQSGGEFKSKKETKLDSAKKVSSSASELKSKKETKLVSPKKAPSSASELKSKNERNLEPPKKVPSLLGEFKSKNETKLVSSNMAPKKTSGDIRFQKLKHGCVCRRPDTRESFDCLGDNHFGEYTLNMKKAKN